MSRILISGTAVTIFAASLLVRVHAQAPAAPTPRPTPPGLAGPARQGHPDKFMSTIQGTALDSANRSLPGATLRLRDARQGQIVETQVSDAAGTVTFGGVEPGSYILELIAGNRQTVVATSELINVNAGEVASAVVKLPLRTAPLAGVLGRTASSAAVVIAAAAAAGVLATAVTASATSPQQ